MTDDEDPVATPPRPGWDPKSEIAAGSVSANAKRLFGAGGLMNGGGSNTKGGGGGDANAGDAMRSPPKGEKWDPSREISRGSVSSNAALWGGSLKKKKQPQPVSKEEEEVNGSKEVEGSTTEKLQTEPEDDEEAVVFEPEEETKTDPAEEEEGSVGPDGEGMVRSESQERVEKELAPNLAEAALVAKEEEQSFEEEISVEGGDNRDASPERRQLVVQETAAAATEAEEKAKAASSAVVVAEADGEAKRKAEEEEKAADAAAAIAEAERKRVEAKRKALEEKRAAAAAAEAEAEATRKAEEDRLAAAVAAAQAEAEAKQIKAEEEKRSAAAAAAVQAEAEAKRKADKEKAQAEAEAKRKAEEERAQAEAEAQRKAKEEGRLEAKENARAAAEEARVAAAAAAGAVAGAAAGTEGKLNTKEGSEAETEKEGSVEEEARLIVNNDIKKILQDTIGNETDSADDGDITPVHSNLDGKAVRPKYKGPFLSRFDISPTPPLRHTAKEVRLRAVDRDCTPQKTVVLQLMSDPQSFASELCMRDTGADDDGAPSILPVAAAFHDEAAEFTLTNPPEVDVEARAGVLAQVAMLLQRSDDAVEGDSVGGGGGASYPYVLVLENHGLTLDEHLDRAPNADLRLARAVASDVVVGLMQLHTVGRVHRNLTPRCIVRSLTSDNSKEKKKWQISELGSCGEDGELLKQSEVGSRCPDWGFLPPEAARAILAAETEGGTVPGADECDLTDPAWDLWSLGCVLYRLVFGSDVWKASRDGRISEEDLAQLAGWSTGDIWRRATKAFPPELRMDQERAAIDLVARLLAPTPEDRLRNFELGIFSVHQHEFIEGKPLESPSLLAFEQRQSLLTAEIRDHERFLDLTGNLRLEDKWELHRARDVLLLGAFEPVAVHIPTSFVILKRRLPHYKDLAETSRGIGAEKCLEEAMKWLSVLDAVAPLVRRTLIDKNVRSIGQFWAKIGGMFEGGYCYFYFVDDLTGEPIVPPPSQNQIGQGGPYPIPIKTRSDILPKLLPLLHMKMRSIALYHGAVGLARMFGAGPVPILSKEAKAAAQAKINNLKDENGGIASKPFGSFVEDIEEVRRNKEFFFRNDKNVRCEALKELVHFFENKSVIVPGGRGDGNFVGLHRLSDENGRAIWTLLDTADDVKAAILKRAEERLKEEQDLWGTNKVGRAVRELESALDGVRNDMERTNHMVDMEQERAEAAEKRILELEEDLLATRKELEQVNEQVTELGSRGLVAEPPNTG